jgi:hypothetical protein
MKTLYQSLLLAMSALALAGTAYAQVPLGTWSGNDISDNNANTGMGTNALHSLTTGSSNTGSGFQTLINNTTGNRNTASGVGALYFNQSGNYNSAIGGFALEFNSSSNNTAAGYYALNNNSSGSDNTAVGYQALQSSFSDSLGALGTGSDNTAIGSGALYSYTSGSNNTASGYQALNANSSGSNNNAFGWGALKSNTSGSNNVAMGYQAGLNLTTGSNNIDIGNVGVAGESNLIRIGTKGTHKGTIIAGINSSTVTGAAVYVTTTGRLGVLASSERFKTAIAPMESSTAKLEQLRPVKFHLKSDPKGALQYGLIAEEVAKVYPELVIRDEQGRIDGVRYDELAPMLLNEVQTLVRQHEADTVVRDAQLAKIASLERKVAEVDDLKQQLSMVVQELTPRDNLVTQR